MERILDVVVETPGGSRQKFDWESETRSFRLNKIMPLGLGFPYDFGFIPGTCGGDGDPIDVMIISEFPTFTGCRIHVRLIGGVRILQQERDGSKVRNDRFFAVPEVSQLYANVEELQQLPEGCLQQIQQFFISYNEQAGKELQILDQMDAEAACKLIRESLVDLKSKEL